MKREIKDLPIEQREEVKNYRTTWNKADPIVRRLRRIQAEYRVHTCRENPEIILEGYRPSESDIAKKDARGLIVPITSAPFNKFYDEFASVVTYRNVAFEGDEKARKKVENNTDIKGLFEDTVKRRIFDNPNGYVTIVPDLVRDVFKPYFVPYESVTDSGEGDSYIVFNYLKNFVYQDDFITIIFTKEQEVIAAYETYIDEGYYPYQKIGGYEIEFNFQDEVTKVREHHYHSFTCGSFDYATLVLQSLSDKRRLATLFAHPITEITAEPCPNESCHDGFVREWVGSGEDMRQEHKMCNTCGGAGVKPINFQIGATIARREYEDNAYEENPLKAKDRPPYMTYYSPPLEGLEFHAKDMAENMAKYEESLSKIFIHQAQSAVAKQEDRKRLTATIDVIGQRYFLLMENAYNKCALLNGYFKEVTTPDFVRVILPPTFHDVSVEAVIENMRQLKELRAGAYLRNHFAKTLSEKMSPQDDINLVKYQAAVQINPYLNMDSDQLMALAERGFISVETLNRNLTLYSNLDTVVNNLLIGGVENITVNDIINGYETVFGEFPKEPGGSNAAMASPADNAGGERNNADNRRNYPYDSERR